MNLSKQKLFLRFAQICEGVMFLTKLFFSFGVEIDFDITFKIALIFVSIFFGCVAYQFSKKKFLKP